MRIQRTNLPPALLQHLMDRIESREIPGDQLELLAAWLDADPEAPDGLWYKKLPGMTVCGEGPLIKTFQRPFQAAKGERL